MLNLEESVKSILLVDDDIIFLDHLSKHFKRYPFFSDWRIDHVNSMNEALDKIVEHPNYDIMFTDNIMPNGTGFDLMNIIDTELPDKRPFFPILITGHSEQTLNIDNQRSIKCLSIELQQECIEAGFYFSLSKNSLTRKDYRVELMIHNEYALNHKLKRTTSFETIKPKAFFISGGKTIGKTEFIVWASRFVEGLEVVPLATTRAKINNEKIKRITNWNPKKDPLNKKKNAIWESHGYKLAIPISEDLFFSGTPCVKTLFEQNKDVLISDGQPQALELLIEKIPNHHTIYLHTTDNIYNRLFQHRTKNEASEKVTYEKVRKSEANLREWVESHIPKEKITYVENIDFFRMAIKIREEILKQKGIDMTLPPRSAILVDDDDISLSFTEESMNAFFPGIEINTTNNPFDVLEMISSKKYDILITDYNMPGLTGIDLLLKLNNEAKSKNIPASNLPTYPILTTAFWQDKNLFKKILTNGFFDLIKKNGEFSNFQNLSRRIYHNLRMKVDKEFIKPNEHPYILCGTKESGKNTFSNYLRKYYNLSFLDHKNASDDDYEKDLSQELIRNIHSNGRLFHVESEKDLKSLLKNIDQQNPIIFYLNPLNEFSDYSSYQENQRLLYCLANLNHSTQYFNSESSFEKITDIADTIHMHQMKHYKFDT